MPLPQGYKAQEGNTQEFEPIPEGIYQVEISDITTKTVAKFQKPDESEEMLDFEFTILDQGEAKARRLWKKVRPFVTGGDKPSYLYQIMQRAFQNPDLTVAEAAAIEVGTLIGKQIVVMVDRKKGKADKVYNNITAFSSAKTAMEPVEKSEPATLRATEDRITTIKAIFATAKGVYPTLAAAPEQKEALKEMVKRDFNIEVPSWSKASLELLSGVYRAIKDKEATVRIASLNKADESDEQEIRIEDIPF